MSHSKRYDAASKLIEKDKCYLLKDAVALLKQMPKPKFDETVNVTIRLGVDPKHADQIVKGTVVLPRGIGKEVKVLVIVKGEKEKEAMENGADFVGAEDMIEKILKGWLDFDVVVATPDMMKELSKLGKILGPKGLMPNPKMGTVTFDVGKAVRDIKAGKVEFKVDDAGVIHTIVGKASFNEDALLENLKALLEAVLMARPSGAKGQYLKNVCISSSMGPAVKLDRQEVVA